MMLDKLDAATRLYQTNEKCIAATRLGAKLLEKVILGMKIQDAFRWARQCESLTPGSVLRQSYDVSELSLICTIHLSIVRREGLPDGLRIIWPQWWQYAIFW